MTEIILRDAEVADMPAIAAIYAHHVQTGYGSFEEIPPSVEEMVRRFDNIRARGLPWRLAELDGRIVGYCYVSPYQARSAYRFTVQDSIYIDERFLNRGIGSALLGSIIEICTALGYRQMMAGVGDSGNEGSLRLHTRMGFRTVGHAVGVGIKFGRWLDLVLLQRPLGQDRTDLPAGAPTGYLPPADQMGP
ncbi:MAG TPA: GNAT family N-acetyltransferase [Aliidongia sp.]|uniref:GNAT family N-acetyltransferase n=1 Tax=Aliidongia sp. TaxID=1914230 RepID=UPI002DDCAF04|nr:GNAT family N-acetyltransferase [Aliidongia sp.]HEV2673983.1 GNAT family N-acetyltransferase [Aliidongia sp.]